MRRIGPAIAVVLALLLLAVYFLSVRVPEGSAGVLVRGAEGSAPEALAPGIHFRSPGSQLFLYATTPVETDGEVLVTPASGGEIPVRFVVSGRVDPTRLAILHPSMLGSPVDEFLSAQTGALLRRRAASAGAVDVITPKFREEVAGAVAGVLRDGGILDARVTLRPPDEATLMGAAQYLAARGEAWKIRQTVAEALLEEGASGSWKLHTTMGLVNESDKQFTEAEKNYLDALAISPAAVEPMSRLVTIYTAVKEWVKLQRVLDAALSVDPRSVQHINWTAMVLLKQGELVGAERFLQQGLALEPSNTGLMSNLATLYMKTGRSGDAIDLFRRAVGTSPDSPQALLNLGTALAATNQFEEALPQLEKADQAGAMSPVLARTLAIVHRALGHAPQAAAYDRRAKELETGSIRPAGTDAP